MSILSLVENDVLRSLFLVVRYHIPLNQRGNGGDLSMWVVVFFIFALAAGLFGASEFLDWGAPAQVAGLVTFAVAIFFTLYLSSKGTL